MPTQTPPRRDKRPAGSSRNPDVHCLNSCSRRASGGFTLIEILVAISIIALLVGISAVGATIVAQGAQRARVKAMCASLLGAQDEFKAQLKKGQNLNHDGNAPVNWPGGAFARNAPGATGTSGGGGLSSSERLVAGCYLFDKSREMLNASAQGRGALVDSDTDGFLELRDPWETELVYRSSNDGNGTGPDGIANNLLPIHAFPFVVSAGPDREFGTDDDITSTEVGS